MSGHSKWATTKRHKAMIDAKRGKIFSLYSKDITLAARQGGGDIALNPRLRTLVAKAKTVNMPSDNIQKAIAKGKGEGGIDLLEHLLYEGYGPGGVGILIEVTTENKNRTVADVRSVFNKLGGNLANSGAVSFGFSHKGQFLIGKEKISEEKLFDLVLDKGAEDILSFEDHFEIICPVNEYDKLSELLESLKPESSGLAYLPISFVEIQDEVHATQLKRILETLNDLDDVKEVFSNHQLSEAIRVKLGDF